MHRTHTLGELTENNINESVILSGWVDRVRDIGGLVFISMRDRYGVTQCIFESEDTKHKLWSEIKGLSLEDCIKINGTVRSRNEKDKRSDSVTGKIEVFISKIEILTKCAELPFQVKDEAIASDELRLKYRYLDLRRPKMQRHLEIKHQIVQAVREELTSKNFLEIETPVLVRSTPEGARDFVVPSRVHPGKFYALPQSPQLYKQMLMISGCDRYFQFATAFRDEDLRADRVPAHTQVDMEMAFVEQEDVFEAVEGYMKNVFSKVKNIDLKTPFPHITFKEAMDRFGCDKPDLRFGLELKTVTEIVKGKGFKVFDNAESIRTIVVDNADEISRKEIEGPLLELCKIHGAKGLAFTRVKNNEFSGGIAKFVKDDFDSLSEFLGAKEGSLLLFIADTYEVACKSLSAVRLSLSKKLNLCNPEEFNFVWVVDFPLFEWDEDRKAYNAMHHLFSQPMEEDIPYLDTDPGKVRGQLYDLVLNGVELASGSIRINQIEIQKKILDIVQMPAEEAESKFGFLLNSFKYGAPPHGGTGLGLDRLAAILCGVDSIKEVIAFPCNNQGIFPLDDSPQPLDEHQLKDLNLTIKG